MSKCTVTLDIARLGRAYVARDVVVADVEARADGTFWTTAEGERVPLSNAPLATIALDRQMPYRFTLPDGRSDVRLVPDADEASYSGLLVLSETRGDPLVLALEPDVFIETAAVENGWIDVGDYLMVDNPDSPEHGDLYQKTS